MLIDDEFDKDEEGRPLDSERCVFPTKDKHGYTMLTGGVATRKRPTVKTEEKETFDLPDEPPPGWAEV